MTNMKQYGLRNRETKQSAERDFEDSDVESEQDNDSSDEDFEDTLNPHDLRSLKLNKANVRKTKSKNKKDNRKSQSQVAKKSKPKKKSGTAKNSAPKKKSAPKKSRGNPNPPQRNASVRTPQQADDTGAPSTTILGKRSRKETPRMMEYRQARDAQDTKRRKPEMPIVQPQDNAIANRQIKDEVDGNENQPGNGVVVPPTGHQQPAAQQQLDALVREEIEDGRLAGNRRNRANQDGIQGEEGKPEFLLIPNREIKEEVMEEEDNLVGRDLEVKQEIMDDFEGNQNEHQENVAPIRNGQPGNDEVKEENVDEGYDGNQNGQRNLEYEEDRPRGEAKPDLFD